MVVAPSAVPTLSAGAYRAPAKVFHWLTAALVLSTIPAGQLMVRKGLDRPLQDALFIYHKNIGMVILGVVLLRLVYRIRHPPPPLPPSVPVWQRRVAGLTHEALYLLLIVQAVSGYIRVKAGGFPIEWLDAWGIPSPVPRSGGLADAAQAVHRWNRLLLIALIALHIGAALFHAVVLRDGVFQRMWPTFRRR
ncbi:cytochrome b [Rubellimicrobium arenae]|uniref:cytochrome b n=1 Tax=Rubellimicrobium arenae TaxID=2817372 RepID=UPI001B31711A|nr:cytochrome b/b6 domain-containing protein [Rubellimicrobium arenae]